MLLFEIIDTEKVTTNCDFNFSGLGNEIGEGGYAKAYKSKDNIHHVVKVANLSGMGDPYLSFIRILLRNQDNPFFPRIYSAKICKTPTNASDFFITPNIFIVEMETLMPLNKKVIEESSRYLLKQAGFEFSDEDDFRRISRIILDSTSTNEKRHELRERSKNPQFVKALDALEFLFNRHMVDTHSDNWMIRLTQFGKPQLVIIDPVA